MRLAGEYQQKAPEFLHLLKVIGKLFTKFYAFRTEFYLVILTTSFSVGNNERRRIRDGPYQESTTCYKIPDGIIQNSSLCHGI